MAVTAAAIGLMSASPHYVVPHGYTRCPHATAWHGFFKWASERHTSCAAAEHFMRVYGDHAGAHLPREVAGYRCQIHYWRDDDGQIYASRHICTRDRVTIRFYGMV